MTTVNTQHTSMSNPRLMSMIENTIIMVAMVAIYYHFRADGLAFLLLFLIPDLSALGYLINKQIGAYMYNIVHNYALPIGLAVLALSLSSQGAFLFAVIWGFHIAIDRVIGYGFKYVTDFKDTHIQRL